MKKIVFVLAFFVSVNAMAQAPVVVQNLSFQTISTVPDSAFYKKADVQIGQPYLENSIRFVNIYVTQEDRRSEADIRTRKLIIKAPAGILSQVLVFDPLTMSITPNKVAIGALLIANGIQTQVQ